MSQRTSVLLVVLLLFSGAAAASEVTLTLVPDGAVTARPGSGAAKVDGGKAAARAQVAGDEDINSCEVYGRQSSANGRASVTALAGKSPSTLTYRLDAAATASGGHYRTGTCLAGRRIGFSGHDTEASVDAVATAVVRIHFDEGRPDVPYFVKISRSQSGSKQDDELMGPDGKVVALSTTGSPFPVIMSRPGQSYFLRTAVAAAARSKGGCCSDQGAATTEMTVSVEPAPLLFGSGQRGYIRGGTQTESYKNVAVVMLDGLPHCTATLVAPSMLVTAAHCVHGHMTKEKLDSGKVQASFGSVYSQALFAPIEVTRASYPDSGDMVFDPKTLRHDIALLRLKTPVNQGGITPAELHAGTPSWKEVKAKGTKILFVGFGFNVLNNEMIGLGIKREASWAISGYDDLAVSFSVPGTNTCFGDSGGPGFIEGSSALMLAGITSGGDDACTSGFDTRIDAYLGWLKPRITQ
ncbi:hypothetical protein C7T35_34485 [Variovorax sp. WS11]|uniref:S1 family peptidase n=1 Tax=Variovorax sp. WS11 TaxID=1105204 RepID=UPI000D0CF6A0|nr:trypsin-like serine protease [Variovorax sp. WS11]NDZ17791.1 trypsin-like serine protease [Variovorax sp. WS11]PSL80032.1 hypothetical protein C7T35_34485 [Variovorax sp. WS11]